MMGEEVEGFEARSMTTIRAGNVDGRAGRFKRDPTSFDAAPNPVGLHPPASPRATFFPEFSRP
jgi:hypothetical protein